jgi:orotate phosphoribosyltransferase
VLTNLFQRGDFSLRSGEKSKWKLELDALTKDDWEGLATIAVEILPPFQAVLGVPRGGIPFANALRPYQTDRKEDPILIAEDVCTTGGSMERFVKSTLTESQGVIGVCVFARHVKWPFWVFPLFGFHPREIMIVTAEDIAKKVMEKTEGK